ncbi:Hemerythrin domain protein [hydrothermal vent metagenome]|uniref:Hemerythrin domain protein n=1 Tax=hydrothermal vent metagenome TaxID=652676 RepID=A0A3B0X4Q2_9ZZZZ
MAHIKWTNELNTEIQVIDSQHHRIVDYINNLYDVRKSHDRNEVEKVLNELVNYTLSHFAFEESLLEDVNYPFINGHKRVHALFIKRVSAFQQRFQLGEDITDELLAVLKSWLINHIRSDDNDYAAIVRANMPNVNANANENAGWISRSVKKFFG